MNSPQNSKLGARPKKQHKRLVLDANILIRAVLGTRVRQLIADACQDVAFYVAEANYDEAEHYLAELAPARGITETVWQASLESVMAAVQLVGQGELAMMEKEARARIALRDERDWPAVAAALLLTCPVWTEDQDFFGAGVATWITATVEIYLKSP
jgi:predicted nucleic acid-binding protein